MHSNSRQRTNHPPFFSFPRTLIPWSCEIYLQTYRHDMTYSVLKVPLNPNQPTNLSFLGHHSRMLTVLLSTPCTDWLSSSVTIVTTVMSLQLNSVDIESANLPDGQLSYMQRKVCGRGGCRVVTMINSMLYIASVPLTNKSRTIHSHLL